MNKKIIIAITSTIIAMAAMTPFLLSYKVKAVEISQNVQYIGSWQTYPYFNTTGNCNINNSGSVAGYAYNAGTGPCTTQISFQNMAGKGFNNQYVLEISLYFYELRDREPLNTYNNGTPGLYLVENGAEVLEAEFLGRSTTSTGESSAVLNYYFRFNVNSWRVMANGSYLRLKGAWGIQPNEYASAANRIVLWALSNGDVTIDTQGIINKIQESNNWLAQINQNIQQVGQNVSDSGANIAQNIAQNETNAGQTAQQDGNQASGNAQSSTQQGTQSLLNALGGFVGAITSATPTNCTISGNMGMVDLGLLNFCRDQPPTIVQIIGSIILIGLTIPIVIWVIKKIISMFRSFTNG